EQPLPPTDVAPAAELPADLAVDADRRESHRLVQADAGLVRQGDPREGGVKTLAREQRQQRGIERAADPLPWMCRIYIDRDIARAGIGGARAMRRTVRIAGYLAVELRDEPAMARAAVGDA